MNIFHNDITISFTRPDEEIIRDLGQNRTLHLSQIKIFQRLQTFRKILFVILT